MVSRETSSEDAPARDAAEPPAPPPVVAELYPTAVEPLAAYGELLATDGVVRGLIGPREVPRLWERHLLNCAVVEGLIGADATVADVGSGAGLPGLVLAIVRPDLRVTLVEPLLRRSTFLAEAVESLGLENVEVVRSRVEDLPRARRFDVVTARAVAALDRLATWCAPVIAPDGRMLALKGERAEVELTEADPVLVRLGLRHRRIVRLDAGGRVASTAVVELARNAPPDGDGRDDRGSSVAESAPTNQTGSEGRTP